MGLSAEVKQKIERLEKDLFKSKHIQEVLLLITKGTSNKTGKDFFLNLVRLLASALGLRYAFVGKVTAQGANRIRTLAVWANGDYAENFEYDLGETPCANVLKGEFCLYDKNIQQRFPEDDLLVEMGIESYMGTPLFGSQGETIGVLVAMHDRAMEDISFMEPILTILAIRTVAEINRIHIEDKLSEERNLSNILLNNMPCAALLIQPETREIVVANEPAIKAGAVVGKQCFATWGKRNNSCPWCLAPELWATGETQKTEVEVLNTTWDTYWIPVADDLYLHYAFDITKLKLVERELQQAKKKLEARVKERTAELETTHKQLLHAEKLSALGKLAASISHEFNNPVFGIKMVLEDISEQPELKEKQKKSLSLAIKECRRISRLTKNLQVFYRPSSGLVTDVDIHQILEEVLQMCGKKLMLNDIKLTLDFAKEMPKIPIVEDQIKQVFLNIVTNAEEAMAKTAGNLTIQTRAKDDKVYIIFKDNGHGILSENIGKIFEPFFSTKGDVTGIGLGLSVSYGIIKKHKGKILVESVPNIGSSFTIELPRALK